MSRRRHAAAGFSLAAAWLLVASPVGAQPSPAGVVKHVDGTAIVVRAGQELPVRLGQTIIEGDTIRTAGDGRVGLTLKDGTRLSLASSTELILDEFAYQPAEGRLALALKLVRGAAEYISGRIARLAPGAVKVETPKAIIGIRGTRLLIGVDAP